MALVRGTNYADMIDIFDGVTNGNDQIYGLGGNDFIHGLGGNDAIYGGDGNDDVRGDGGNDTLWGGNGADHLDGGAGNDIAYYLDSLSAVVVDLAAGTGDGGTAEGDTLVNIENVAGSDYGDSLFGNASANALYGLDGNDFLSGAGGTDNLYGGAGNDTLKGGGGADLLAGGAGIDTASYYESAGGVDVSLFGNFGQRADAEGDTFSGIENVIGSAYGDGLRGDNGANVLYGLGGNDILHGDGLDGAPGGDDILYGGDGDDGLSGGTGSDILYAGAGSDVLSGLDGNATMFGGDGSDHYAVDGASDMAIEAVGEGTTDIVRAWASYSLTAGSEIEYLVALFGTAPIDLVGNEFDQTIFGNNGGNTIVGSPLADGMGYDGLDVMTGNGGGDVFVWTSTNETRLAGDEADVITDFSRPGGDLIALNLIDADDNVGNGDQAFAFVGIVDFTGANQFTGAGQIGYFTTATDTYILLNTVVDPGPDGVDYQEATIRLIGVHAVDASWFAL